MACIPLGHWSLRVAVALLVFPAMDLWAAVLHGRLWHGPLWCIHKSHHAPREGAFERNDVLSTLHAPIAAGLIVLGCRVGPSAVGDVALGVGAGMTTFGVAYLVIHDGLVHGRLPVAFLMRFSCLRAIVDAHRRHHEGRGGVPYGILFGPWELRRAEAVTRDRGGSSRAPLRTPSAPPSTGRGSA